MSIAIVLNPASGRGRGARTRALLESWAQQRGASLFQTRRAGDATQLAHQAARNGADLVVAAGGDGTLGEVLNGIMGSGARLGVVPLGTGNDFARTIGIGRDVKRALHALENGAPRAIDVGRIEIGGGSRYFLNVAGAGFDSRVAQRINAHQPKILARLSGTAVYLVAVAAELRDLRRFDLQLELDGELLQRRAVLCAVANAKSYGGGMLVAPDADVSDGWFDVCLIGDVGRGEFARAFPGVFRGQHVQHPRVEMRRAAKVRLQSAPPLPVLADGEVLGSTPATFEMKPRAVEIWTPRQAHATRDKGRGFK